MNQGSQKKRRFESPLIGSTSFFSSGALPNTIPSEDSHLRHRSSNINLTLKRKGKERSPVPSSSTSSPTISSFKRAATFDRVLFSHAEPVKSIKRSFSSTPNSSSTDVNTIPSRVKQRLGHASLMNLEDDCSICIESVNPQDSVLLPCQHYCKVPNLLKSILNVLGGKTRNV